MIIKFCRSLKFHKAGTHFEFLVQENLYCQTTKRDEVIALSGLGNISQRSIILDSIEYKNMFGGAP